VDAGALRNLGNASHLHQIIVTKLEIQCCDYLDLTFLPIWAQGKERRLDGNGRET
jgi:hypothetical protein